MDNLNYTSKQILNENEEKNISQDYSNFINLDEPQQIPTKFKSYVSVYIYLFVFVIALIIGGANNSFLSFVVTAIILIILGQLYISALYDSISYVVTNQGITMNYGIVIKKSKTVIFNTIQTMESKSGLLMSAFGLVDFKISLTSPSQIVIDNNHIQKSSDIILSLSKAEAQWLTNFIAERMNKK